MADPIKSVLGFDDLHFRQADGERPRTLTAGIPPGESGVSLFRTSFEGGAQFRATPHHHIVCFKLSPPAPINCRIAGRVLRHYAPFGSMAILPAGQDCSAEAEASLDAILVAINPSMFALAATERAWFGPEPVARLSGQDSALFELVLRLESESAKGYPEGALFWNDIASELIARLLDQYSVQPAFVGRGRLRNEVLSRIKDYILEHLSESIDVDALACLAALSPFHFSRAFRKAVGVTPHRFVTHLRLRRATELIRERRLTLAEVAVSTGFADQSHLTRWVQRVHGVTPKAFI